MNQLLKMQTKKASTFKQRAVTKDVSVKVKTEASKPVEFFDPISFSAPINNSPVYGSAKFIQFGILNGEELKRLAVCEVTVEYVRGSPTTGTPYDDTMGPLCNGQKCPTCGYDNNQCVGHFGYIDLVECVYNPKCISIVKKVLECVCIKCAKLKISEENAKILGILKYSRSKRLKEYVEKSKTTPYCIDSKCGASMYTFEIVELENTIIRSIEKGKKTISVEFTANECYSLFIRISNKDFELLGFNSGLSKREIFTDSSHSDIITSEDLFHIHQTRPESYIFKYLPVIPTNARSWVISDNEEKKDDDVTVKYNTIAKLNRQLKEDKNGAVKITSDVDRKAKQLALRISVATLIDNHKHQTKVSSGGRPYKGIADRLGGKTGRVQTNIAGKRVDFSARAVITSGGPLIKVGWVGVPQYVAKILTKEEVVNSINQSYIRKLFDDKKINYVIRGDKKLNMNIVTRNWTKDFSFQEGDVVERQMIHGDYINFNRQPSLRDASMMGKRAHLLKDNTNVFRLPLPPTTAYNADFDGDEMNLHLPQSLLATAETSTIMRTATHIVSGQKNGPICGIIQDALVAGFILTAKLPRINNDFNVTGTPTDVIVEWGAVFNCIMVSELDELKLLWGINKNVDWTKHVLKRAYETDDYYHKWITRKISGKKSSPVETYEFNRREPGIPGRLLVSFLFPHNFSYTKASSVDKNYPFVKIKNGIILHDSGPLCKNMVGAKTNSIIHILWKEWSPDACCEFLSYYSFMMYSYMPTHGFSVGISDCLTLNDLGNIVTTPESMASQLVAMSIECEKIIATEPNLKKRERLLNTELNSAMNIGTTIAKKYMNKGNLNSINIMRECGAKGSILNISQISCLIGQQNLDGKRIPMALSNGTRCLPHFPQGCTSVESRGFVSNSYLQGLKPAEMYFHTIGGRRGVIDTSIKSVIGDTEIFIQVNGVLKTCTIGSFIDGLMAKNSEKIKKMGHKSSATGEMDMELLNLAKGTVYIPTCDNVGNVTWGEMTAVTRHSPGEILYKFTTRSGRSVTATAAHSMLVWNEDTQEFEQVNGGDVEVGDLLPVVLNLPRPPGGIKKSMSLEKYLPKTEFIYGSEMKICRQMVKDIMYRTNAAGVVIHNDSRSPAGWWDRNNGTNFTVPYKHLHSILRANRRTKNQFEDGFVYPFVSSNVKYNFPENFEFDEQNGFFIGLFLADGDTDINSGCVRVTKNNVGLQDKVKEWFDRYNVNWNVDTRRNNLGSAITIRGFSSLITMFLLKWLGKNCYTKKVPKEIYYAPKKFIKALLDGYFSGDGCVSKSGIISACSVSKNLRDGIVELCSLVGIFCKVSESQQEHNNLGTENIARMYNISISGVHCVNFANTIGLTHDEKREKLKTKMIVNQKMFYKPLNETVLDPVIKIEEVDGSEYNYAYDVTVPSTSNFMIKIGLLCRDTAESGYIQKRVSRKCEDLTFRIDGTVRTANNNRIVQFVYGDDGFNPKMLYYTKGCSIPFFINLESVADKMNSERVKDEELKNLTVIQITRICSLIQGNRKMSPPLKLAFENITKILTNLLKNIKIYPSCFDRYKDEICKMYESSKEIYGTPVGLLAATATTEPASQATLNTFHAAGISAKDVTLGVPRLDEILNATTNQATPSCNIYLNEPKLKVNQEKIKKLLATNENNVHDDKITEIKKQCLNLCFGIAKSIEKVVIKDLLRETELMWIPPSDSEEHPILPINIIKYDRYDRSKYKWWLDLYNDLIEKDRVMFYDPKEEIEKDDSHNQSLSDSYTWVLHLVFDIDKLYRYNITLEELTTRIELEGNGNYYCIPSPNSIGRIEVRLDFDKLSKHIQTKTSLKEIYGGVGDDDNSNGCPRLLTAENISYFIIRDVAVPFIGNIHISGLEGIKEANVREDIKTKEWYIDTEGTNLAGVLALPNIDTTRTFCDNMWDIYYTFGIECCRTFIYEEFTKVISFDGTYINPRHITLLIDAMTYTGIPTKVQRDGIDRDVGPVAKLLFEKVVDNMFYSGVFTENDQMKGFASSVMYGKSGTSGTGAVSIIDI